MQGGAQGAQSRAHKYCVSVSSFLETFQLLMPLKMDALYIALARCFCLGDKEQAGIAGIVLGVGSAAVGYFCSLHELRVIRKITFNMTICVSGIQSDPDSDVFWARRAWVVIRPKGRSHGVVLYCFNTNTVGQLTTAIEPPAADAVVSEVVADKEVRFPWTAIESFWSPERAVILKSNVIPV